MNLSEVIHRDLNPAQIEAVETLQGPLLILAGAGSGKTRVLTYRTANLIAQGEATPGQIWAVTFTNKAAREMESRILGLLRAMSIPVFEPMWISTFHSSCARILREHIHLLGYQPFFNIYDDSDQLAMIKKVMNNLNINEKMHNPKAFKAQINEAKMLAIHPDEVERKGSHLMNDMAQTVYATYEEDMRKANSLDFGDLLLKTYDLLCMYPDIKELYQNKFRFIMVDEYQDTNHIQYCLVKTLAQAHNNLCVVGDEDQSIYSWRGADIRNILDFEKDFPACKVIKLEENYRSTKTIVTGATAVIANNSQRKAKTLFTQNAEGDLITVREERTDYDEARFVAQTVKTLMDENPYNYKDFAVFYRTNAQSRVIEDQLRSNSLPYRIVGGLKFYERMEIKDLVSYMKVLLNPTDDISLKRIINVPTRGIGKTTLEQIETTAFERKLSMYDAILHVAQHRLVHSGACNKLVAFRNLLDKLREETKGKKPAEIYHQILDETQYVLKLKEENTIESLARIENLEELNNAIVQFEQERGEEATLQAFLEEMALVSDVDKMEDKDNSVTLMTLHVSKGLEYPNVIIVGMEEGLFPSQQKFNDADPTAIEEERRLAYVGMTRARENLFLTYARSRRVWGQEHQHLPSRFIKEIPQELIKFESTLKHHEFFNRLREQYSSQDSYRSQALPGAPRGARAMKARQVSRGEHWDATESQAMPDYDDFPSDKPAGAEGFKKGQKVKHPTFGFGSVFAVEGQGDTQKVSVVFADHTSKKFVAKYARLEKV